MTNDVREIIQKIESAASETYTPSEPADDGRCPVCHGTGWEEEIVPEPMYGEGKTISVFRKCTRCKGGLAERAASAKIKANLPVKLSLADFDWSVYGEDLSRQQKRVQRFVERFTKWEDASVGLFITSRTRGSGKTFLAQAIAGELMDRYTTSVRFVSASDLLEISRGSDDGRDPLNDLISCRVLILDDLGQKLTGREWLTDVLFRLIDKRYQKRRVTIVTSNVPLNELDFDDRIADRLNAMTAQIILPEYCVRAREANERKIELLKELGID